MRNTTGQNRTHWIALRQEILAKILASKPNNNWTPAKIAEAMKLDPIVSEAQPKYSIVTARRDWYSLSGDLARRRGELVDIYLNDQLEQTDNLLDDLLDEWSNLKEVDIDYDSETSPATQASQKIKAMNTLSQAIERLMKRQANLLPLEVPKKLEIEERRINLDIFLEARNQRSALKEGVVIDGTFEER